MNTPEPSSVPPRLPPPISTVEKVAETVAHSFIHKVIAPVLLLPIFCSGLMIPFLFSDEWKTMKSGERVVFWSLGGLAVLGTLATIWAVRYLRARPADWHVFQLGRAAWIILLSVAWLAGVACAVFIFPH